MLFPSLVRGVVDDVTGKTTCHHWLREEPPGAVYSWARRCWAHARTLCRGITIQFVILLQGHEPFILSNPLFCHSNGGRYDFKKKTDCTFAFDLNDAVDGFAAQITVPWFIYFIFLF